MTAKKDILTKEELEMLNQPAISKKESKLMDYFFTKDNMIFLFILTYLFSTIGLIVFYQYLDSIEPDIFLRNDYVFLYVISPLVIILGDYMKSYFDGKKSSQDFQSFSWYFIGALYLFMIINSFIMLSYKDNYVNPIMLEKIITSKEQDYIFLKEKLLKETIPYTYSRLMDLYNDVEKEHNFHKENAEKEQKNILEKYGYSK
jgi:hypothetical protein